MNRERQLQGSIRDDTPWQSALRDSASLGMSREMRELFALIISRCKPYDPVKLWEEFKEQLSEDFLRQQLLLNPSLENVYKILIFNESKILIEDITMKMRGKSFAQLGMKSIEPFRGERPRVNEESYDTVSLRASSSSMFDSLNDEQKDVAKEILHASENPDGKIIFLEGPAGTGKTYLLNYILCTVRMNSQIALAVASPGMAATRLYGGRTAHSAFELPFKTNVPKYESRIRCGTEKAKLLERCKLIIWDQFTMANKKCLEAVNMLLQGVMRNKHVMGGKLVVLSGDFRQSVPIIKDSSLAGISNASFIKSELWEHIRTLELKVNMRVRLNPCENAEAFEKRLLDLGEGRIPTQGASRVELDATLCTLVPNLYSLIERVYPSLRQNIANHEWLKKRAILTPQNATANIINSKILELLDGEELVTESNYSGQDEEVDDYPMGRQELKGHPPRKLILKKGCPVIVLENLHEPKVCNGTRLIVNSWTRNLVDTTILTGPGAGSRFLVPRLPSSIRNKDESNGFPLRLAFCLTIHKAQGESLEIAGVDLSKGRSYNQLYMAFSRVGSPNNLFVLAMGGRAENSVLNLNSLSNQSSG